MAEEMPPSEQQANQDAPGKNGSSKRNRAFVILLVMCLICVWFGARWWYRGKTHIETDNAFIEANIVALSSRVPGTVKRVLVRDNQYVKKGDLLVELDEDDYRAMAAQAAAGVGVARNESEGDHQKVEASRAALQLARARHDQAGLDLQRGEALFLREVIPKEQLDRQRTAHRISASQLKEAEEVLKQDLAEAGLGSPGGGQAKVRQKQAQLDVANLQLSYTRLTAPADGYITRKGVEPGANIQAGQPLMALVPLQDAWVVANYKERQLTHITPGQKVEFTVDAYPGRTFTGRVDSIMAGTGAAFSLLPPENATGNYVKVVQRIPVKIVIDSNSDPAHLLRVGMSVVPTVLVERSTRDILGDLNPFK